LKEIYVPQRRSNTPTLRKEIRVVVVISINMIVTK